MMRSGNAVSSHSGLIPSENLYEKREGLLWPIARKRNLISLPSVAFFTIFVCNLVHAYKFHGFFKNRSIILKKKLDSLDFNHQFTSPPSFKDIERKVIKWGFKCQKLFLRFCVYKRAYLIIHWHCF